jgi:hypothetical protein
MTQNRPSNVDDAGGSGSGRGAVGEAEINDACPQACLPRACTALTGQGVRTGICAWAFGAPGVSSISVVRVGGSEGSSDALEKLRRPSEGSNIATKVSAV